MKILVETSARHVHLSDEHLGILFGKGHALTIRKELSQPGQFVCDERVDVSGPRNILKNVSILGPTRKETQVEISLSDARMIGVEAMIRESGMLEGTAGITLTGPQGSIELPRGCIAAKRHIHLSPSEAEEAGVSDKEIVSVRLETCRPLIFEDVVVRVNKDYRASMHIDTDESNAAGICGLTYGEIIK